MSEFADVEQFAREHRGCGGITPSASPQPSGGFMLSLACACGATFERWVTLEESKRPLPPLPRPSGARPGTAPSPPASLPPVAAAPDLYAALRAVLDADDAPAAPAGRRPAEGDIEAIMQPAKDPRPAPSQRTSPAKINLDITIRTALAQQAEMRTAKPAAGRTGTRVLLLALFTAVALGAAGLLYVAVEVDVPPEGPTVSAAVPAPAPTSDAAQRAALDEVMKSLRTLQSASNPNTTQGVYASRVLFAKADVERFLSAATPGPSRAEVREVLDVHMLAAAAWKARTLEQKELWEPVGQDAAVDLCPSVKRVADFALQPDNVTRAHARGVAVASVIPLLWECAAEKIAAIDRRLAR